MRYYTETFVLLMFPPASIRMQLYPFIMPPLPYFTFIMNLFYVLKARDIQLNLLTQFVWQILCIHHIVLPPFDFHPHHHPSSISVLNFGRQQRKNKPFTGLALETDDLTRARVSAAKCGFSMWNSDAET